MKSVAILSNITIGLLAQELNKNYDVYVPAGYDTWDAELCNHESELNSREFEAEFILLYADALEEKWNSLTDWEKNTIKVGTMLSARARKRRKTQIFISTLDFQFPRIQEDDAVDVHKEIIVQWYQLIKKLSAENDNIHIYDWSGLIYGIGKDKFYSDKMWYTGSMPYSISGIKKIAEDMEIRIKSINGKRKKCIAVDLDNTLWGGIAGEDGIEGITLSNHNQGAIFYDFQKRIKEIKELGVILVILSKNNLEDVKEIIASHPYMVLRWEDFAGYRINWEDKSKNIIELADELNIGLDSMIFIDDNLVEREAMRFSCPEVTVPDFPQDISKLSRWMEALYRSYFFTLSVTKEDKSKTEMYHQEKKRRELVKTTDSFKEYLRELGIEVEIHPIKNTEWNRAVQLCMKTNQFNLTTKRYSLQEISEMVANDKFDVYTVYSKDRYGENGLISLLIIEKGEKDIHIDTFLMSCRVMGRHIENVIISVLIDIYKKDFEKIYGYYTKTLKNYPVAELYTKLGFRMVREGVFEFDMNRVCWVDDTMKLVKVTLDGEIK